MCDSAAPARRPPHGTPGGPAHRRREPRGDGRSRVSRGSGFAVVTAVRYARPTVLSSGFRCRREGCRRRGRCHRGGVGPETVSAARDSECVTGMRADVRSVTSLSRRGCGSRHSCHPSHESVRVAVSLAVGSPRSRCRRRPASRPPASPSRRLPGHLPRWLWPWLLRRLSRRPRARPRPVPRLPPPR